MLMKIYREKFDNAIFPIGAAIVFILSISFAIIGRLLAHNTLVYDRYAPLIGDINESEITVIWDGEEIPNFDYGIKKVFDESAQEDSTWIHIVLEPQKSGVYAYTFCDSDGTMLCFDKIHVGKLMTAYSEATGSFTGDNAVVNAGVFFLLGLCILSLIDFIRCKGCRMYSYRAILSCGIFMFFFFSLVGIILVYIGHLRNPTLYSSYIVLSTIADMGKYFMVVATPVILIFSILLVISNIALLLHEKPAIRNVLALSLGSLLVVAELYSWFGNNVFLGSYDEYRTKMIVSNVAYVAMAYVVCLLGGTVICGLRAARHKPPYDRDYIVILGCGFRKDGTLTPQLKGRVDKAVEFWNEQKEKTQKEAILIPSGGQGSDESMSEAQAMKRYLLETGFPEELILTEDASKNTYQNMEFSKRIIESNSENIESAKTAFSTTNYHVFRSGIWSNMASLHAEGIGSKTKWWYWPNAFIREWVGLLVRRAGFELVGLALLSLFFAAITGIMLY